MSQVKNVGLNEMRKSKKFQGKETFLFFKLNQNILI